jgi:hypothetical protein
MAPGARRVPRSLVLVDGALTETDLEWVNRQLAPPIDLSWMTTETIR